MTDIKYTPGPLLDAVRNTPMVFWNDSPGLDELCQSISYGGAGATYNPVIAYTTIKKHLDVWAPRIQAIVDANPIWGESEIGWKAAKGMSQGAAKPLEPVFSEHKGCNDRLSVRTDPYFHRDARKLIDQAEKFHNLIHNIVVKIPATKIGLEAIEDTISCGISINVIVSFSVPQAVQAAEVIERGLKARKAAGHGTSEMGPAVTTVVGRLDDWLKHAAARDGILIDPSALEWAGIAAMKRTYQIFQERGYRARMLAATFYNIDRWAEFVGGDVMVSPPPKRQKTIADSDYIARERIADPVDSHYIVELECIPDFIRAHEPDGMAAEGFGKFGPTRKTLRQFLATDADLDAPVRGIIVLAP